MFGVIHDLTIVAATRVIHDLAIVAGVIHDLRHALSVLF
jgi:hypothetical protein